MRARERRIAAVHVHAGVTSRWCVRIGGRDRARSRHSTKRGAVTEGRRIARRYGVPLITHRWDGTVESVVS